ncbi:MAG: COR domain-containing protein [Bacteroidota bacterium]
MSKQNNFLPEVLNQIERARRSKSTTLNLDGYGLHNLPGSISQLTNLRVLSLSGNKFTSLPSAILSLTELHTLDLSANQLSSLPVEFGRLQNLSRLYLSNNHFKQLPNCILELKNLKVLSVNRNRLQRLPERISELKNLTELLLFDNLLENLPPSICTLPKLSELSLSRNQLSFLPTELIDLTTLLVLDLKDNPLKYPPMEIALQGIDSIRNYVEAQADQGVDQFYEAKLLIVGEPGAGKTSLKRRLLNPQLPLPLESESTHGIEIDQMYFKTKDKIDFRVNIWDFGGQEIYHSTHQFFLTRRSLYVLLADNRREDTDFYYWLQVQEMRGANSPLIIIQNQKGGRKKDINHKGLKSHFGNLQGVFETNLLTLEGLQEVEEAIRSHLLSLPHIGDDLPKNWLLLREELEIIAQERDYIRIEEFEALCKTFQMTDKSRMESFSRYLHDLGVFLHFQEDVLLKRVIILNNTYVTKAVYTLLDHPVLQIQLKGQFHRKDLQTIWKGEHYDSMREGLLKLMRKFELCYQIEDTEEYIVPSLLPLEQPEYEWNPKMNLILRFSYKFMPKGLMSRFIVRMNRYIDQKQLIWRNGVILSHQEIQAEVIEVYLNREIQVRIRGQEGRYFMSLIIDAFDRIHDTFDHLEVQKFIPCNCSECKKADTPYLYEFDRLHQRKMKEKLTIECERSYQNVYVSELLEGITLSIDKTVLDHKEYSKKEIREMVANNEIDRALNAMKTSFGNSSKIILLRSQWTSLRNDQIKGLISRTENELSENKLKEKILSLLDTLKKD